jgi:hypothetical protein
MNHTDLTRFGPFASVVAVALALVATFAVLLLKQFGRISRWTWLSSGAPSFMVTAAARTLAVVLMAVTYVTINKSNYIWFAVVAVVCGLMGFTMIAIFDRERERHVVQVPEVGPDGKQLVGPGTKGAVRSVVIGLEQDIREPARTALVEARKSNPSLSVIAFMSGFGIRPYDPEALWDHTLLADIRNRLTVRLMWILLLGVMALFIAAFIVEVKT